MMQIPPQPLPTGALAAEAAPDVQQRRDEESRGQNGGSGKDFPLKFCTVCASNQNRFVLPFAFFYIHSISRGKDPRLDDPYG